MTWAVCHFSLSSYIVFFFCIFESLKSNHVPCHGRLLFRDSNKTNNWHSKRFFTSALISAGLSIFESGYMGFPLWTSKLQSWGLFSARISKQTIPQPISYSSWPRLFTILTQKEFHGGTFPEFNRFHLGGLYSSAQWQTVKNKDVGTLALLQLNCVGDETGRKQDRLCPTALISP